MEQLNLSNYKPKLNPKARKPNVLFDNIKAMLGNKFEFNKKTLRYEDTGKEWTNRQLGIYLGGVPKEWLRQYYSASVDAKSPAIHFQSLVKQSRLKVKE